ncbi:MAG: ribokinase [Deltaproteobacteria bacterium]|nr:ribokinase [Deltaproteobacteria bacterium]
MGQGITVVGSLNADLVVAVRRFPGPGETVTGHDFAVFPGGKGANQAFAAGLLAAGDLPVRMIGQVGGDTYGEWLRQSLARAGVDVAQVRCDSAAPTGLAMVAIDAAGQNQIVVVPGANGTFNPAALTAAHHEIADAAVVLLQLEVPLPTVQTAARIGREGGAIVILDPAPARAVADVLLRSADYLTPNESELSVLTGGAPQPSLRRGDAVTRARQLIARGAKKVLVKMGRQGALLVTETAEHLQPAFPVEAIDTTAAGDAFNAGLAFALARGAEPIEAIRYAAATAAVSVTRVGAQPGMPARADVDALYNSGSA